MEALSGGGFDLRRYLLTDTRSCLSEILPATPPALSGLLPMPVPLVGERWKEEDSADSKRLRFFSLNKLLRRNRIKSVDVVGETDPPLSPPEISKEAEDAVCTAAGSTA